MEKEIKEKIKKELFGGQNLTGGFGLDIIDKAIEAGYKHYASLQSPEVDREGEAVKFLKWYDQSGYGVDAYTEGKIKTTAEWLFAKFKGEG